MSRRFFEDLGTSLIYEEKKNIFSSLNPATKLVYVLLTFVVAFLIDKHLLMLLLLITNMGIAFIDKGIARKFLMLLRGLWIFILMIFVFNTVVTVIIGGVDIVEVLLFQVLATLRVFTLMPPLLVFITSTTPIQIVHLLSRIGIDYAYLYPFVIAYRFIPMVFNEMKSVYDAQRSRGVELEKKGLVSRLKSLASLVIPTIVCSTIRARDLAEALIVKGFGYSRKRVFYSPLVFSRIDVVFISVILVLYSLVLVVYHLGISLDTLNLV